MYGCRHCEPGGIAVLEEVELCSTNLFQFFCNFYKLKTILKDRALQIWYHYKTDD